MNKLGITGVGLIAVVSMGGGMLLTGSVSASSTTDVGTVHVDAVPAKDPAELCVRTNSATEDAPEGALVIPVGDVGEPSASFDLTPGSTWQSVSIDADGNITTDQGTDGDLPIAIEASEGHSSGAFTDDSDGSGVIAIPEADIELGGTCHPLSD